MWTLWRESSLGGACHMLLLLTADWSTLNLELRIALNWFLKAFIRWRARRFKFGTTLSLTHSHSERPKQAIQFWVYFSIKSIFRKIFEGEMLIRSQTTTLLLIFCELLLYSQVIFKSMKVADDTSKSNSECEWVKMARLDLYNQSVLVYQRINWAIFTCIIDSFM